MAVPIAIGKQASPASSTSLPAGLSKVAHETPLFSRVDFAISGWALTISYTAAVSCLPARAHLCLSSVFRSMEWTNQLIMSTLTKRRKRGRLGRSNLILLLLNLSLKLLPAIALEAVEHNFPTPLQLDGEDE